MLKKRIKKETFNHIRTINYSLFLLLFYINTISYVFFNNIEEYKIYFLLVNLTLLVAFYFFNKVFCRVFIEEKKSINKLINGVEDVQSCTNNNSNNNYNDIYKLFKRVYIKKNIAEKDYGDLKENFQKLVPKKFIEEIGKGISENINIGMSIEKRLHIMFIDISGFTKISEKLTPSKTLFLLNIYFDGIVEISKENGGYIDKFLGDGIMIVFDGLHSDAIIKAAIEIKEFVNKISVSEFNQNISVGIGINSGKVILGTIGAKDRMDITIVGDTVNTAARLENLTREIKEWIVFSKESYKLIKYKDSFPIHNIGKTKIRGKEKRMNLYGINEE